MSNQPLTLLFYSFVAKNVPYNADTAGESVFSNETYALPPLELLSINSGGGWDGDFIFDAGYIGGTTYSVPSWWPMDTSHVSGSAPADVYRSNRWANFEGYFFYVLTGMQPLASYKIRLDFAEIYWSSPYRRNFDVYLNDTRVLQNFDMVLAAGGPNTAVAEDFNVTTDINGDISAFFVTDTDNAQVNGIEDFQFAPGFALTASPKPLHLATGTTDTASVTVAPLNSYAGNVSLSASIVDSTNTPVPGITASCGSTPLSVIDGASHTAPVSIAVASNVPDGTYTLKATGTDTNGTATQTALLPVIVSSLTVMRLVWTTDYTTTPVTQIASTQGKFGGNATVHLTLAIPPGAYSPIATSVVVHEVAAPDASGDIVVNNFALSGGPSLVCGEPNPLIPSGWSASYGDVSWPVGGRNGNYLVTATVQYTDSTGDMHNFTETDTFDREDLLITSTTPSIPDMTNPLISDPIPFAWGSGSPPQIISATIQAAYKSTQQVRVTIRDSSQNVIKTITQALTLGSGPTNVNISWDGSSNVIDPISNTYDPAPLGIYQYQIEVYSADGDYDSSRSSQLLVTTTSTTLTSTDNDNYYFAYSYILQDSTNIAAKSGHIWVYNPDMQKIASFDLSTLPDQANNGALTCLQTSSTNNTGAVHTVLLAVPISNITFGGDYRFYLHFVDGHAATDKGANGSAVISTEEKCANDENARKTISGPITYINSGQWYIAWALQNRGARRSTILETPAVIHAPLVWVNSLRADARNYFIATDSRTEQQIQAAVNGTFFPYTVYNSNSPNGTNRANPIQDCPDPTNPIPWEPGALDKYGHPKPIHRALSTVISAGQVGPSWNPSQDPISHARWCFSMNSTGPSFMALQMLNLSPVGKKPKYIFNPAVKALPFGLSNIGGLITTAGAPSVTIYHNLAGDEIRGSFGGSQHSRTAIGWTASGDFFLVTINAASWNDVRDFFHYTLPTLAPTGYVIGPIVNAFMLDGGDSSQLSYLTLVSAKLAVEQSSRVLY